MKTKIPHNTIHLRKGLVGLLSLRRGLWRRQRRKVLQRWRFSLNLLLLGVFRCLKLNLMLKFRTLIKKILNLSSQLVVMVKLIKMGTLVYKLWGVEKKHFVKWNVVSLSSITMKGLEQSIQNGQDPKSMSSSMVSGNIKCSLDWEGSGKNKLMPWSQEEVFLVCNTMPCKNDLKDTPMTWSGPCGQHCLLNAKSIGESKPIQLERNTELPERLLLQSLWDSGRQISAMKLELCYQKV